MARTLLLAALPLLAACPASDGPCRVEIEISGFEIGTAPFRVRPVADPARAGGVYIPGNLEEALAELKAMTPPEVLVAWASGPEGDRELGGTGMWLTLFLRQKWDLFAVPGSNPLLSWFGAWRIWDPEDVEQVVLTSLWRDLNGSPIDFEGQLATLRRRPGPRMPLCDAPVAAWVWSYRQAIVHVDVDRAGVTTMKGSRYRWEVLLGILFTHAETARDETRPDLPSLVLVALRCDREAPWSSAREVLRACLHPQVRAPRLAFLVEDRETGRPGYVGLCLDLVPPSAPPEAETTVGARDESVQDVITRLRELQRKGSLRVRFPDAAAPGAGILATIDRE